MGWLAFELVQVGGVRESRLCCFVMCFYTEEAPCSPQFNLSQFLGSRDLVILKPHGILITVLLLIIGTGVKETSRVLSPARERQDTRLFLHTLGCVSRSDMPYLLLFQEMQGQRGHKS